MKLLKKITKGLLPIIAGILMAATVAGHAYAIPYDGDNTPPAPGPAFNVFTGVPGEGNGDENDFLRGKVEGDTAPSQNDVSSTCETGKRFQLRVYVHNGATKSLNDNGNGASVAKDTKVKVDLKNAAAGSKFSPAATISASNTNPLSVTDGMNITCSDGKTVKLSYVAKTAKQYSRAGVKDVDDSIVTTGAPIGTEGTDGKVWGCWEERVYVTLIVEVKEVPKEVPSSAVCLVDDKAFKIDGRKVTVSLDATLQNATKTGKYEINWGDGSAVSTKQSDTHTYAKDGSYTITGRVEVKLNDGTVKWVNGDGCTKQVSFKANKPMCTVPGKENLPVDSPECKTVTKVTPPANGKLGDTGAGDMAGIFTGVSAMSAGLHQLVTRRRNRQ